LLLIRVIAPLLRPHTDHPGFFSFTLGIFAMLLGQMFINAAMNMGILPITGITLPFVSYGGSSILSWAMCFGLLWALGRGKGNDRGIAIS
jgi:cell division protein FtsW (lipid II flippase)